MIVKPAEKLEILIDIEALGGHADAAIIEVGAVAFNPIDGSILSEFHHLIKPAKTATADLDTLEWHRRQGTWPRVVEDIGQPVSLVLMELSTWAKSFDVETFWSWGSTYDFPHLDAAFQLALMQPPWRYSRCQCARTVWNLAFPDVKATPKNHSALDDARVAVRDLIKAVSALRPSRIQSPSIDPPSPTPS